MFLPVMYVCKITYEFSSLGMYCMNGFYECMRVTLRM